MRPGTPAALSCKDRIPRPTPTQLRGHYSRPLPPLPTQTLLEVPEDQTQTCGELVFYRLKTREAISKANIPSKSEVGGGALPPPAPSPPSPECLTCTGAEGGKRGVYTGSQG